MRRALLPALLALVWAGAPVPAPAGADIVVQGRIGDVFLGLDTRDRLHRPLRGGIVPPPRVRGAPLVAHPSPFEDLAREQQSLRPLRTLPHKRRFLPRFGRHVPAIPYAYPYAYRYRGDRDDDYSEAAPPPPPPPEPQVAPEPPTPPDARGPQWETARGRSSPLDGGVAVGRHLPRGVPHVTLDWQDYDLPRPPAGQTYARVGTMVVLIEADSRLVRRILWPEQEG